MATRTVETEMANDVRPSCAFCLRPIATTNDWKRNGEHGDEEIDAPDSQLAYLNKLCWEPEGDDCLSLLAESGRPGTLGLALAQLQAAEQQRDRLRVKAGEARVLLEDGKYGAAHAILNQIRDEEDIEAAETQDREDDEAAEQVEKEMRQ